MPTILLVKPTFVQIMSTYLLVMDTILLDTPTIDYICEKIPGVSNYNMQKCFNGSILYIVIIFFMTESLVFLHCQG